MWMCLYIAGVSLCSCFCWQRGRRRLCCMGRPALQRSALWKVHSLSPGNFCWLCFCERLHRRSCFCVVPKIELSWMALVLPGHGFHHHLVENKEKGKEECSPPGKWVKAMSLWDTAAGCSDGAALGSGSKVQALQWLDWSNVTMLKRVRIGAEQGRE